MKTRYAAAGVLVLLLAGALLVSGCTTTGPAPAAAAPTGTSTPATTISTVPGGTCRPGLTWCTDHCSDLSVAFGDCGACGTACPAGQSCLSGTCCDKGRTLCNGTCSNTVTDNLNCGGCGTACPNGSVCYDSRCRNRTIACPEGQTLCLDERCYDLSSDNMNCGRCGTVCPAFSGCTDGVCVGMDYESGDNPPNIVINMPV